VILSFSADSIDRWLGPGKAYLALQNGITRSGSSSNGTLNGVGYCDEHDQISVEWTAGAILASRALSRFYQSSQPSYAMKCSTDAFQMTQGMENDSLGLRTVIGDQTAYSYSLVRKYIPFGWWAHNKFVLSTASTGWMIFVKDSLNPFNFFHSSSPVRLARNDGARNVSVTQRRLFFKDGFITYFLPEPSRAKISIHDSAGKTVFLMNSDLQAFGWHAIKLPAKGIRGVYIFSLKTAASESHCLFNVF
jgi:hypothetical protein